MERRQPGNSQGSRLCYQAGPYYYCTPQTGPRKWGWLSKTYLEVKGNYWQCLNIFINNINKNSPHFQFCFSLVLNIELISCLDGYFIRLPFSSGSTLSHLWWSDVICALHEGEGKNPTWSLKSPSQSLTAAHPAATVLWYPTLLKCYFLIPFYISIFLGH